jgi:4-hydroxythreonine-4-phosphate dehydrogenase
MGDPAGIGPEVLWGAWADGAVAAACRLLAVADLRVLERARRFVPAAGALRPVRTVGEAVFGADALDCLHVEMPDPPPAPGRPSAAGGEGAYRCVVEAVALAQAGAVDAICTAPLSKEVLHLAGHRFPGHTELLASLTGARDPVMLLISPRLRVVHVTTHVGLADVPGLLRPERILTATRLGADAVRRAGNPRPRIGVCGLNPHAGEGGLFGRGEEAAVIQPAVAAARAEGLDVQGPLPADSLFVRAAAGAFDLVVAMYHDQGHIPVKLLGFSSGVNVTLGLPIVRTSPDHGTAFDLAGTGQADPGAMRAAVLAAAAMAAGRAADR